jgi:CheY-like chemotaxis protein
MHEEIKVLIIEDEEMWAVNLSTTLDSFGYTVAGLANSFESAVSLLNTAEYDIVLLDINLNNRNSGIEIAQMIKKFYHKPFIFITANSSANELAQAIATGPSAYLSKPITPSSLVASLHLAITNHSGNITLDKNAKTEMTDVFFVKQGNKYKKLKWTEIAFLRTDKNYTAFFNSCDKTEYYSRSSMAKTLNFIIPSYLKTQFIQINRAEAVHLPFITELVGDEVHTPYKTLTVTEGFGNNLKKAPNVII